MGKKILYVVNELPYPARNGVTIPSFHYLQGLAKNEVNIDILYLPRQKDSDDTQLKANLAFADNMYCVPLKRKHIAKILLNQMFRIEPSYFGYTYKKESLEAQLKGNNYDVIIYTPISAMIVKEDLDKRLKTDGLSVGILSDCYSYALKMLATLDNSIFRMSFKYKVISKIKLLEGWLQESLELKIVNRLDVILCQTEVDEAAFRRLGFQKKILVLSNGVDATLRKLTIEKASICKILFMGILSGKYEYVANWLILDAWPKISLKYPNLVLKLVGKGLSVDLQRRIRNNKSIEYIPYVESLNDVYLDSQILIAPIFMRCGLINKTIEAMAAGLVVMGDETAFNGIPDFKHNIHGYQFRNLEDVIYGLGELLENKELFNSIRLNAKQLVNNNFDWDSKTSTFNSLVLNRKLLSTKDKVKTI
jgi:glycosyltransferase involved in cell wall biosynthesis